MAITLPSRSHRPSRRCRIHAVWTLRLLGWTIAAAVAASTPPCTVQAQPDAVIEPEAPEVDTATLNVYDQLDLLVDVRHEIVTEFVEQPDETAMIEAAVRAMVESLNDPYTIYLSASELEPFDREVRGSFSGIGAEVRFDPDVRRARIVSPLEDSPAWRAGVMAGDLILEVDGQDTLDMPLSATIERLTGQEGTPVVIRLRHESGQEETLTIVRARIDVPTIKGLRRDDSGHWQFIIDAEHGIGYVRILQFTGSTADDLRRAIEQMTAGELRGLILDLRFDPGGMLQTAVDIADMFLPKGQTIVSVRGRASPERVYASTREPVVPPVPVVVLANEASASAAEILTGALSDNHRAVFVGARTFGKGSVQQVRMLASGGSAIKITNAYYYLPSGRNIHRRPDAERWGVDPDEGFYVPMTAQQTEAMLRIRREGDVLRQVEDDASPAVTAEWAEQELADPQLAAALRALLGRLETDHWPVVGETGVDALARQARREQLERQRQRLEQMLSDVDQRIARLAAGLPDHGEPLEEAAAELADGEAPATTQPATPSLDNEPSTQPTP